MLVRSRRIVALCAIVLLVLAFSPILSTVTPFGGADVANAEPPGNGPFDQTWARTDKPVADGVVQRTWMWGPEANTPLLQEDYAESPDGQRTVQYFDKSRMEITHPDAENDGLWYVTNGLLATELITGQVQQGEATFEPHAPPTANVAGDQDHPNGPTYATFTNLLDAAPLADGATITQRLSRDGTVTDDPSLATYGATAAWHVQEPNLDHQVASPFWDFMNSTGTVWDGATSTEDQLFVNPFYATGYPITEAYWANVKVNGSSTDVLMQCFQRRCLTWTPGNPDGWQVEAGNVGQHYYTWRYETNGATLTPTETATSTTTATSTVTATGTSTGTTTATSTGTATGTSTGTATSTSTGTSTGTTTTPGQPSAADACLNTQEQAFLTLINQYRAENSLPPLTVSAKLNRSSYFYSYDMATRNYFPEDHSTLMPFPSWLGGPGLTNRLATQGYSWTAAAENILYDYTGTAADAFATWKNSPGHNTNMLRSSMTQIGIGRAYDSVTGRFYWTTDFAAGENDVAGCQAPS